MGVCGVNNDSKDVVGGISIYTAMQLVVFIAFFDFRFLLEGNRESLGGDFGYF